MCKKILKNCIYNCFYLRNFHQYVFSVETAWEAPAEGFLSLLQQKTQQNRATAKKYREVESFHRKEALLR